MNQEEKKNDEYQVEEMSPEEKNKLIIKIIISILIIITGIIFVYVGIKLKTKELPKDKLMPIRNYNKEVCKDFTKTNRVFLNTVDKKRLYFEIPTCLEEVNTNTFNRIFETEDKNLRVEYNYLYLLHPEEYYQDFEKLVVTKKGPLQEEDNKFMQQFRVDNRDTYYLLKKMDNNYYLNVVIKADKAKISLRLINQLLDVKEKENNVSFLKTHIKGDKQEGTIYLYENSNHKKGYQINVLFPDTIMEREIIFLDNTISLVRNLYDQIVEITVEAKRIPNTNCENITGSKIKKEDITFAYYVNNNKEKAFGCRPIDENNYYLVTIESKNYKISYEMLKDYFNVEFKKIEK